MASITRRQLVKGSAAALAAASLPSRSRAWRRSPNEEIRVGVVGLNGRGRNHVSGFRKLPGVSVVALCDVDARILAREAASLEKHREKRGEKVQTYRDVRDMLERDDVDVIAIATPNHWHALMTVWACQAGKDVYVEKPVSHDVREGFLMVRAARKHRRIVQTGTQSRSSQAIADAIAWLHEGHLGKITLARGLCYKPRQSIGLVGGPQPVSPEVDYDLWIGPAPMKSLERKRLHYDWHWVFDTGNGDLGNQGVHQVDMCRWALGMDSIAPRVLSIGGRFGYQDDANTPNTLISFFDYEPAPMVFEVRGLPKDAAAQKSGWNQSMDRYEGVSIGVIIHCEGGHLKLPNYSSAQAFDAQGKELKSWKGAEDHFANFIAAVRSRRASDLSADIREGHLSSALCHTANASYLLGDCGDQAAMRASFAGDAMRSETYGRFVAHLEANGVDLARDHAVLGAELSFDASSERCTSHPTANMLLQQRGREPFNIPELV